MKIISVFLAFALTGLASLGAGDDSAAIKKPAEEPVAIVPAPADEASARAEKRYSEMLDRMQAAVEEVAQLYGNPTFLQVFTNDSSRATQLRQRLKDSKSIDAVRSELASLQKKRDDLAGSVALMERESAKLTARLTRQRSALDTLGAAFELARKAVEDTAQ